MNLRETTLQHRSRLSTRRNITNGTTEKVEQARPEPSTRPIQSSTRNQPTNGGMVIDIKTLSLSKRWGPNMIAWLTTSKFGQTTIHFRQKSRPPRLRSGLKRSLLPATTVSKIYSLIEKTISH